MQGRSFEAEEEFGREREDAPVLFGMEERTIGSGLAGAEVLIEVSGSTGNIQLNWKREVELIDVAGADQLVDVGDALGELLFGDAKGRGNWGL